MNILKQITGEHIVEEVARINDELGKTVLRLVRRLDDLEKVQEERAAKTATAIYIGAGVAGTILIALAWVIWRIW